MEQRTITPLPLHDMRVLKQVNIIQNGAFIGYILYERKLTEDYKFSNTEKKESSILDKIDYPKQASYPTDNVDLIISEAIKASFPESTVRNYSIVFNTDKDKIENLQKRNTEDCKFYLAPDILSVELHQLAGYSLEQVSTTVKIYIIVPQQSLNSLSFFGSYDFLGDKKVLKEFKSIKFI